MCGEMGKAVLRALTGALLCNMVSDAAYLQTYTEKWPPHEKIEYEEINSLTFPPRPFNTPRPDFELLMDHHTPAIDWYLGDRHHNALRDYTDYRGHRHTSYSYGSRPRDNTYWRYLSGLDTSQTDPKGLLTHHPWRFGGLKTWVPPRPRFSYSYQHPANYEDHYYHTKPLREHEKPQDLRNVPGIPGVDYPIYHEVPHTSFSCAHVPVHPGMYANVETGCQAWHVCHDGREGHQGASFLCTNGTLFNQELFACDWWYNVDCSQAIEHYKLNADPLKNPYVPKPKPEELEHQGIYYKL